MKGWRTILFNAAMALFGVAQTTDWGSVIQDPKTAGLIVAGMAVANAGLRAITTTPVGKSTPAPSN